MKPFQPLVPVNVAIYNACRALCLMAGTEPPDISKEPEWQIVKRGCNAVALIQAGGGFGGTVTSVGLSMPAGFSVSNTPIENAGVLQVNFAGGQPARRFLATPSSGVGAMSLREITLDDLPAGIGGVSSVNGETGDVELTTLDIPSVLDHRYVTDAQLEIINAIESILTVSGLESYSTFTYSVSGDLTTKLIYADSSLSDLQYTLNYTYSSGNLSNIEVIRASDSFTYNKIYTYDINDNLSAKEIAV